MHATRYFSDQFSEITALNHRLNEGPHLGKRPTPTVPKKLRPLMWKAVRRLVSLGNTSLIARMEAYLIGGIGQD